MAVTIIWQSLVVSWETAGALWASGNDASAPKPCQNPESSSDESFVESNAVVQTSVIVWYVYMYIYILENLKDNLLEVFLIIVLNIQNSYLLRLAF